MLTVLFTVLGIVWKYVLRGILVYFALFLSVVFTLLGIDRKYVIHVMVILCGFVSCHSFVWY
jgi:hypothetical protein